MWVPPFKQEECSLRSQSEAGESGLHCQLAVQSPSALKVLPPRWSTQWCLCHQSDTQTGSRSSGWSLQMPQTPCFCWAPICCGRNGNQMRWPCKGSSLASHPDPRPTRMGHHSPGDINPYLADLFVNQHIKFNQTMSIFRYQHELVVSDKSSYSGPSLSSLR